MRSGGSANRVNRVSRHARLTARGWAFLIGAAVLMVCAYSLGRPSLLLVAAFVAAVPLLSIVLVRFQRLRIDVRRSMSPLVVTAGRPTTVTLEISNLSPRPMAATLWRDECGWAPSLSASGRLGPLRGGSLRHREPRASARLRYELVPPRRGVYEIGPFSVTLVDPFGLARGTQVAYHAQPVTVVPEVQLLPDSGLAIAEAEGSARLVQHRAVGGEHDITTRAYRTGDALRRVHWRASAHHGDLMVRQEEQRSHSEASVLLDTRQDGYRDVHLLRTADEPESDAFEWAIGFTASLVLHLQHDGFLVHMNETGPRQLSSVEHPTEFLESMATLSLSTGRSAPDLATLSGDGRSGKARGSMFVVLSDPSDGLVDSLAAHRGAFELAVAFIVLPLHDRVSEPLRLAGWTCVSVEPGGTAQSAWLSVMTGRGGHFGDS